MRVRVEVLEQDLLLLGVPRPAGVVGAVAHEAVAVDVDGSPAFSADNSSLMLAGTEGSVFAWDLAPRSWLATACRLAGRELTEQEWRSYLGERPYVRVCGG